MARNQPKDFSKNVSVKGDSRTKIRLPLGHVVDKYIKKTKKKYNIK